MGHETSPSRDVYDDKDFLYWVCQRLYEEIRARWGVVEGIHARATHALTAVLGFAAFTAAAIRPFSVAESIVVGLCASVPSAMAVLGVLMPRVAQEHAASNLWDDDLRRFDPDARLDTLASSLRKIIDARDAEIDSKGRWLVATQMFALLAITVMLITIARSAQFRSTQSVQVGQSRGLVVLDGR